MVIDIRRLDIYRKIPKDLTQPTLMGAFISVCCCCFILILIISELMEFTTVRLTSQLFVDNPGSDDRIQVHLNISLPRLPCSVVGLDIMDDKGRHEVGFVENTQKIPLGEDKKGCRFEGHFYINKVPGNFHVSTHSATKQPDTIDMAHVIHEVRFGDRMMHKVSGSFNPLKEMDRSMAKAVESHDYVLKIVPTIYESLNDEKVESYQYTFAYKSDMAFSRHTGKVMPSIWFLYDMTPITVKHTESRPPLYHFLTTVCAIVGGAFTVAGILDSMIFSASEVFKKFEIGKLS